MLRLLIHLKLPLVFLFVLMVLSSVAGRQLTAAPTGDPPPVARIAQTESFSHQTYFPIISKPNNPDDQLPVLPPPIIHSGSTPLDFSAIQAEFNARKTELAFNKIGFHVGPGGNLTGIGDWMRTLDSAGVPMFLKSADNAGPIFEAQELMKVSGVPHTLVYRVTTQGQHDGYDYDVPDYSRSPAEAAAEHWQKHLAKFPPELDPEYVWIETINEVDKNQYAWLGQFALETAQLALRDGYRWAAFGWSAGEPEPENWADQSMLAFLRLAAKHPNQLAVALHEYSYNVDNIGNIYPYLLGRFQDLFQVCDDNDIQRPTVLITEWGWVYDEVPSVSEAMQDVAWAAWLYSAYPQVLGAAIWYLGPGFGDIANDAQKFIAPMTEYSLENYFEIVPGPGLVDPDQLAPWPSLLTTSTVGEFRLSDRRLR